MSEEDKFDNAEAFDRTFLTKKYPSLALPNAKNKEEIDILDDLDLGNEPKKGEDRKIESSREKRKRESYRSRSDSRERRHHKGRSNSRERRHRGDDSRERHSRRHRRSSRSRSHEDRSSSRR